MSRSNIAINHISAGKYAAPTLRIYGDVKVLTAAGTGSVAENATGPGACSNVASRRPC